MKKLSIDLSFKWIDVEKLMPPMSDTLTSENVMTFSGNEMNGFFTTMGTYNYKEDKWELEFDTGQKEPTVTHWMFIDVPRKRNTLKLKEL